LRTMPSWNAVCVKSSNASTKSCTWLTYGISHKGGKVLLMKETLWKNNLNFVKDVPMIM
jgi:hypothetical protein